MTDTLAGARAFVAQHVDPASPKAYEGVECPCCGQTVKLYSRKLYADMAAWLITLTYRWQEQRRLHPSTMPDGSNPQWVDIRTIPLRGGDYGKLVHWDLVERMPNDNPAKRSSGMWRPTVAGVRFVMGKTTVPSHAFLYNNTVKGFSTDKVTIQQVLGESFDYVELMRGKFA